MFKAPNNVRDLMSLFLKLDDSGNIDQLLAEIDWTGVTKRQMYHGLQGRLPESMEVAITPDDFLPLKHAHDVLKGYEFQSEIVERILRAFPEKRRLVFIHVPKCAGTDLTQNLAGRYPRLYEDLGKPHWISGAEFFLHLRGFARQVEKSDSIFVHGHVPVNWFLSRQLCRFEDRYFTVLRDPIDIMLSQVNYFFKRFFEAPRCLQPDSREWADILGFTEFDRNMHQDDLRALGLRALRDPRLVPANYICTYLGEGTTRSALEGIARCNMEMTDVRRYKTWLMDRWQISESRQLNASQPILRLEHLDAADREYVESRSQEDYGVYRVLAEMLERTGASFAQGCDLAKSAQSLSAKVVTPMDKHAQAESAEPAALVAAGA